MCIFVYFLIFFPYNLVFFGYFCTFACEMRSIIVLMTVVTLLGACGRQDKEKCNPVVDDRQTIAFVQTTDTVLANERKRMKEEELAYYLERHNEQDEGYDLVRQYVDAGPVLLSSFMPSGPLLLRNIGHWRSMHRSGKGLTHDHRGRLMIAEYHADTLVYGIRFDSLGIFGGRFTRNAIATGFGVHQSTDGQYFCGQWCDDMREGLGYSVSPTFVRAGHWRKDKFLGEHMHYTPQRIYGIDISRYQHEKNGKTLPINWSRMRIVDLGHRAKGNRISGAVNYPVSFVYIKSTEGISIKNQYFSDDYASAREHGIAVGAYHFFSTRQSPTAQAT